MKRCSICKEQKDVSQFNKHIERADGLQSHCRECNKKRSRAYYKRNQEKHKRTVGERRNKSKQTCREYVWEYLKTHPCVDCNETRLVLLEFDHVRGKKDKAICHSVTNGWSIKRLQNEIDKCEVRCANCHRLKTSKEQSWRISFIE